MGKLTCSCLNVQISVKSSDLRPVDPSALGINSTDEFFSTTVSEVQLSLEGMKFVHPYLVKTRLVSDWTIHQCRGCEQSTHATHSLQGSGKVLVNMGLVSSSVEALEKCSDFSPLYKIVLPSRNDNQPVRSLGLQSGKYESLQKLLGDIQHQLNNFLVREEALMEERIKQFMDSQRQAYADLQSKARRDKNTMVNLVLASEQQEISESLSDAMTESPTSPLSPEPDIASPLSPEPDVSSEDVTTSETEQPHRHHSTASGLSGGKSQAQPQSKRSSALSFGLEQHAGNTAKTKKLPSLSERMKAGSRFSARLQENKVTSSVDPDGDLDFDSAFQDETSRPFYTSDDELEDTDDSETESRHSNTRSNINMFSTSVPISVPMWSRGSVKKSFVDEDYDDEDGSLPHDAASMAASIKALAQSVHGDGTEMFGELPRPRLNTSNFGKL